MKMALRIMIITPLTSQRAPLTQNKTLLYQVLMVKTHWMPPERILKRTKKRKKRKRKFIKNTCACLSLKAGKSMTPSRASTLWRTYWHLLWTLESTTSWQLPKLGCSSIQSIWVWVNKVTLSKVSFKTLTTSLRMFSISKTQRPASLQRKRGKMTHGLLWA